MPKRPTNERLSYLSTNVFEQALKRIHWLYDEFGDVCVSMSGGKDSTVVFELTQIVAKERGIEKVPVLWLDQECEFQATEDYMAQIMTRPDVEPFWMQIPFRLFNATSTTEEWLNVWGEGEQWTREKHPISYKENIYDTDRFKALLHAMHDYHHKGHAVLTGMRIEESPGRRVSILSSLAYKWITWGTKAKEHTIFHPIYDWSWRDIWKAIHDNNWTYNRHYDAMYRYGVPVLEMRVSNYHHETAVRHLFMLQEMEPQTYAKATARLRGISTAAHLGYEDFFVKELPFMFTSWIEYRDYLLEKLLPEERWDGFRRKFAQFDSLLKKFEVTDDDVYQRYAKTQIQSIITNDVDYTKLDNALLSLRNKYKPRDEIWTK